MAVHIPVVVDIDQAFKDAAERTKVAIEPLRKSIEGLTEDLATWRSLLNEAEIGSDTFIVAAKNIQNISYRLAEANEEMERYTSNAGSIRHMTQELAELERKWTEMGAKQKFTNGQSGEYSKDAKDILQQYRRITSEIEKQGQSLSKIVSEEQRVLSAKKQQERARRRENEILKSTEQTITILEQKERILTNRLNSTQINTAKYKQLKSDLEDVRRQLDLVNERVTNGTVPAINQAQSSLALLVKRSLQLLAIHSATSFIKNVREVTAEFELQRVALGGIIQDSEKASALFKEIKAAAIRSPFEIKDLVTYTKQLSAYRVETEDLFHVTMQLADVSAGLGVDMNRLILAYGQVKAASVLRGQELRQFTEAGIPLVKLLADKFEELGRVGTTTADVFELISKRAVPFEMIAEIFDDMTKRGGMFYQMQEKQAETLKGQWNNLKDALSIMYDEMGNTSSVHNAMTGLIKDARLIFQNWRFIADAVKAALVQYGSLKLVSLWMPNLTRELRLARKAQDALTRSQELSAYAMQTGSISAQKAAIRMRYYSIMMKRASMETKLFARLQLQLKAMMAGGGWIGLAVAGLTTLLSVIYSAYRESRRLNNELEKIGAEGQININRSTANFNRLASAAVNAANGSKEQVEAVAELKRTYGDIIPTQELEVEALQKLQGNYESLTRAIREKISEQIREQKVNTIVDSYSKKVASGQDKITKYLSSYGIDKQQVNAIMSEMQDAVERGLISAFTTSTEKIDFLQKKIEEITGVTVNFSEALFENAEGEKTFKNQAAFAQDALMELLDTYVNMRQAIKDVDDSMSDSVGTYGRFAKMSKDMQKSLSEIEIDTSTFGRKGTFAYNQENIRQRVNVYWDYIEKAFDEASKERGQKIDVTQALLDTGKIDFDFIDNAVKEAMEGGKNTKLNTFIKAIKEGYEQLIPSDRVVNLVKEKVGEFADQYKVPMDEAQSYYKKTGDSIEAYVKSLQESSSALESEVKQMELVNKAIANGATGLKGYSKEEVEAKKNTLALVDALKAFFSEFIKTTHGPSYQQDPFIDVIKKRAKFVQDFTKGVQDLNAYLGETNAILKERTIMKGRGEALDFDVSQMTGNRTEVLKWYDDTIEQIKEKITALGGTTWSGLDVQQIIAKDTKSKTLKAWQELLADIFKERTDYDLSQQKKDFEDALKRLTNEIKRSETARNFYQNILDLSGDQDLAATMSVDVYGSLGENFKENMQRQVAGLLSKIDTSKFSEELNRAFEELDFKTILEHLDEIPEKVRSNFEKMAADSQKFQADQMTNWLKELQKAKTYAQKRVELARKTEQRIAEINASNLRDDQKSTLLAQYAEKEAKDVAKLQYEVFKDSPMYVELFSNLDTASSNMLQHMRTNLVNLKSQWKDLDPDNLKEMQARLKEVDKQLGSRNPIKAMTDALREYNELRSSGRTRKEDEENLARASANAQVQRENLEMRRRELENQREQDGINSRDYKLAEDRLKVQEKITDDAIKAEQAAADQVAEWKHISDYLQNAADGIKEFGSDVSKALGGVQKMVDVFATDDVAEYFGIASDGINDLISGTGELAAGIALLSSGQVGAGLAATLAGVGDIISGTFGAEQKARIKAMDEEIERQDRLLSDLEYSYDRLDNAMKDAFGSEYIRMYGEEVQKLYAMQAAYEAQAQAERNKGKKADEDKVKDYEDKARETADRIKDMQAEVANFFAGTDLTSAAKEFATAWIEAYKQFGSTTDAMKEKFNEMIQSMVEQSLGAKIMQTILQPLFDEIDAMATEGAELSAKEIAQIASEAPGYIEQINLAMTNLMNQLAAAGYNVRQQTGTFSGISRNIANASEESITGLAAGVNTQNFYMQHIDMNVAAILATLTGGTSTQGASTTGEYVDPYKDQMLQFVGSLPQMRDDLSQIRIMLDRVIKPKTVTTDYRVSI